RLDDVFEKSVQRQYTQELLFSTTAHLLAQVAFGRQPSVHAAFKAQRAEIPVSLVAVYAKLQHTEPSVCQALVADSYDRLDPVVGELRGRRPDPLPGF